MRKKIPRKHMKDTFKDWRKATKHEHKDKFRVGPSGDIKYQKGWDHIFGKNKIRNREK